MGTRGAPGGARATTQAIDGFGIAAVFATHLELALENMHPEQAFEAAQHATRAYLKSHDFVSVTSKGSPVPGYRMVPKRSPGGGDM